MTSPATAPSQPNSCCPPTCAPSQGGNQDKTDKTLRPLRSQGGMPPVATGVKSRGAGTRQKAVPGAPGPSRLQG